MGRDRNEDSRPMRETGHTEPDKERREVIVALVDRWEISKPTVHPAEVLPEDPDGARSKGKPNPVHVCCWEDGTRREPLGFVTGEQTPQRS